MWLTDVQERQHFLFLELVAFQDIHHVLIYLLVKLLRTRGKVYLFPFSLSSTPFHSTWSWIFLLVFTPYLHCNIWRLSIVSCHIFLIIIIPLYLRSTWMKPELHSSFCISTITHSMQHVVCNQKRKWCEDLLNTSITLVFIWVHWNLTEDAFIVYMNVCVAVPSGSKSKALFHFNIMNQLAIAGGCVHDDVMWSDDGGIELRYLRNLNATLFKFNFLLAY